MVCVHCGKNTRVINSRPQKRLNQTWRRRVCVGCGTIFSSHEVPHYAGTWTIQSASGNVQPFSRDKLFLSLHRSCLHRADPLSDAAALTETIIKKLIGTIHNGSLDSDTIKRVAQVALNRFDMAASIHYQAFHRSPSS